MADRFLKLTLIPLIFCGCSKKDLNLPQPSPMPVYIAPTATSSNCSVEFSAQSSPAQVAIAAFDMHELCGLNNNEILKLARLAAGARVMTDAKNPVFFKQPE